MRPDANTVLLFTASDCAALGLSLDLHCGCSHSRIVPFRLLVRNNPRIARMPLGRILVRLTCQRTCRQHPIRVSLLHCDEHSARAGNGRNGPPAWELVLIGDE